VSAHIDKAIEKGAEVATIESRQAGDPPPTIRLTAPIGGLIAKVHLVPGQPVTADQALVEIVELKDVHAIAAVPEHLVGKLKVGQKARLRLEAYPGREFEAEMAHLGAEADSESGTLEAAFHVENPELLLRPGMRAEFSIEISKREDVMSIPREAVQGDAAARFVFIKDYELKNAFVKVPVVLGAQNDRAVEVIKGLLPGDEVVTRGAYWLPYAGKGSVSLKEALDAAHGHPHNEDGSEMTAEQLAAAQRGADGAGGGKMTPLTMFLIASNVLLLVLLAFSPVFRRKEPSLPT
jgi:RND family efflux transporter MFP subunit